MVGKTGRTEENPADHYERLADAAIHQANRKRPCWHDASVAIAGLPRLAPNGADVGGWGTLLLTSPEASGGMARMWRIADKGESRYVIPLPMTGGMRLMAVAPEAGVLPAVTADQAVMSKSRFDSFIAPYGDLLKSHRLKTKQIWGLADVFSAMVQYRAVREPWHPGFTRKSLELAAGLAWSFALWSHPPIKNPLSGTVFPAELRYAKDTRGKYLSATVSGLLSWPDVDRDRAYAKVRGKYGKNAFSRDISAQWMWKAAAIVGGFGEDATGDAVEDWRIVGRILAKKIESLDFGAFDGIEALQPMIPAWQKVVSRHRHTSLPHLLHRTTYRDLVRDGRWDRGILVPRLQPLISGQEKLSQVPLIRLGHQKLLGALRKKVLLPMEQETLEALETIVATTAGQAAHHRRTHASTEELTARWFRVLKAIPADRYQRHALKKRNGGVRWLDVPIPMLAKMQQVLISHLVSIFPPNEWACAFLPYRGPAWHAHIHTGAQLAVVVDIRDFFGSVRPRHIERWFGLSKEADPHAKQLLPSWTVAGREAIMQLVFADDGQKHHWLPQGAPTSPFFANLAANRLDVLISVGAKRRFGETIRYSRYADDLVLSLDAPKPDLNPRELVYFLRDVLRGAGFEANEEKIREWRLTDRTPLIACGVEVPQKPGDPCRMTSEARRRARAALHRARHLDYSPANWAGEVQQDRGMLSFAYAATGNPGWLAYTSRPMWELAKGTAGVVFAEALLAGVADFLDISEKP